MDGPMGCLTTTLRRLEIALGMTSAQQDKRSASSTRTIKGDIYLRMSGQLPQLFTVAEVNLRTQRPAR